jgi:hypothetical protein
MKMTAFIAGALSIMIIGFGLIFNILHLPGSQLIIAIGLFLFSVLFVPTMFKYVYDRSK